MVIFWRDKPLPIPDPAPFVLLAVAPRLYAIQWTFAETKENYEKFIKPWHGQEDFEAFFKKTKSLSREEYLALKQEFSDFCFRESLKLVNEIALVLGNELLSLEGGEGKE